MNNEAQQIEPLEINDAELVAALRPELMPSKPLFERLLSPQSLGWMMSIGGGLLVLGFAIWLWSIGVFENPLILAVSVGALNLSLLGLGIWLLQNTRHKIAGKGITLLSSLALPLNLWLYDSQSLITIGEGKLWMPAFLISIIYAAIARITKDSNFVYTLVGGFVMTGVLFMAGASNFLWEVLPIATFMIAVGSVCVHADRWFLENDGLFSRQNFGLAFFRAGQIVLILGLGTLFSGQWMLHLVGESGSQLWTLGLLASTIYTYVFSNSGKRQHSFYMIMAGLCSGWAIFVGFQWLQIEITIRMGLLLFNAIFIIHNLFRNFLPSKSETSTIAEAAFGFAISVVTTANCIGTLTIPNQILFYDWTCVSNCLPLHW